MSHLLVIPRDVHVNLVSHEDASSSSSSSCGPSSSYPSIFHSDEDITKAMATSNYPWDDMHHPAYFLPQQTHDQYVVDSKDFIHGEVNWFKTSILAPDVF